MIYSIFCTLSLNMMNVFTGDFFSCTEAKMYLGKKDCYFLYLNNSLLCDEWEHFVILSELVRDL